MDGKVAVLGSADFVLPFSALGLDIFAVEADQSENIVQSAEEILAAKYSLVVVAENVAKVSSEVFETTERKPLPCVVIVPFTTAPQGIATESLGRLLKLATGIDIINS